MDDTLERLVREALQRIIARGDWKRADAFSRMLARHQARKAVASV
jgi:hypothetical protein